MNTAVVQRVDKTEAGRAVRDLDTICDDAILFRFRNEELSHGVVSYCADQVGRHAELGCLGCLVGALTAGCCGDSFSRHGLSLVGETLYFENHVVIQTADDCDLLFHVYVPLHDCNEKGLLYIQLYSSPGCTGINVYLTIDPAYACFLLARNA